MKKNLLIRMDKIGDLILTLPVDQVFEPSDETVWFITQGLEFFPQHASPARQFVSFKKQFSASELFAMYSEVKRISPDRAVVFHAPWWVSFVLWCARVPIRCGVRSKWHSFLFLNKSLRQKRSKALKHEAHYGLDLVEHVTQQKCDFKSLKPLLLSSGLSSVDLSKWGLGGTEYIVVHPGMAGSALNWPVSKYIEFIEDISKSVMVVVTSGPNDYRYVDPIKKEFSKSTSKPFNVKVLEKLSLAELVLVLENSQGVLAPSTGVLHIAASTGVPALGIYSPVGVERAVRWGPRGPHAETLTPITIDNSFNRETVMETLRTDQVLSKFKEMMGSATKGIL